MNHGVYTVRRRPVASPEFGMRGEANLRENSLGVTPQNQQKDAKQQCVYNYPHDTICETTSTTDF